jgi:hypothetical protein
MYMGLRQEPSLEEYWEEKHVNAPVHSVNKFMSSTRFQQIDRYLYCTEVEQSFKSPFGRVWDLSKHIRKRSLELWHPGKHLCVDEAIARFTGRASEIVIIKTKSTPEGYKIWVLASSRQLSLFPRGSEHGRRGSRRPGLAREGEVLAGAEVERHFGFRNKEIEKCGRVLRKEQKCEGSVV